MEKEVCVKIYHKRRYKNIWLRSQIKNYFLLFAIWIFYYILKIYFVKNSIITMKIFSIDAAFFQNKWKMKEHHGKNIMNIYTVMHFNKTSTICIIHEWIEVALLGTLKPLHLILCDSGLKISHYYFRRKWEKEYQCHLISFFISKLYLFATGIANKWKKINGIFRQFVIYLVNFYHKRNNLYG